MTGRTATRDLLLEATISIIDSDGEDGVRVDRVAEMAGFTKPVVYHHFEDREALVVAALTERYFRALNYITDDLKFAAARCRSAEQFSALLCGAARDFALPEGAHRRQLRVEALGAAVSRPALQISLAEANRRQIASLADIFRIAEEEGWLRVGVDVRDLAAWWTGVTLSRHLIEIDPDHLDSSTWTEISEWVIQKMFAEPGTSA